MSAYEERLSAETLVRLTDEAMEARRRRDAAEQGYQQAMDRLRPVAARVSITAPAPAAPTEALCRCEPGVCLLHPTLTTCGLRSPQLTPPPPFTPDAAGVYHDSVKPTSGKPGDK